MPVLMKLLLRIELNRCVSAAHVFFVNKQKLRYGDKHKKTFYTLLQFINVLQKELNTVEKEHDSFIQEFSEVSVFLSLCNFSFCGLKKYFSLLILILFNSKTTMK